MTTAARPAIRAHRPRTRTQVRADLEELRESAATAIQLLTRVMGTTDVLWEATQIDAPPPYIPARRS